MIREIKKDLIEKFFGQLLNCMLYQLPLISYLSYSSVTNSEIASYQATI